MQGVFAGLEVDGLGVGGHGSLLEGFGEGRVGVACAGNVFAGGAVSFEITLAPSCVNCLGEKGYLLNGQGGFGNHLTSVRAKDVDTKDAVGFSVRKEFDLHRG